MCMYVRVYDFSTLYPKRNKKTKNKKKNKKNHKKFTDKIIINDFIYTHYYQTIMSKMSTADFIPTTKKVDEDVEKKYPTDIEFDAYCKAHRIPLPLTYKYIKRLRNDPRQKTVKNSVKAVFSMPVDAVYYSGLAAMFTAYAAGEFLIFFVR